MSMKKVLVTGATGFVGRYVVKELLSRGYEIIATSANHDNARLMEWYQSVRYIPLDFSELNEKTNYYLFFEAPDLLIHLAWEGLPDYKADFHITRNLPRHKLFLQNMLENGLGNLTISGTCLEYGLKEGKLSEEMSEEPVVPYARAKNELRVFVNSLWKTSVPDFKWMRLFYMYGKGQNPKSLLSQLQKAIDNNEKIFNMSGGEQTRDFLPVEKVAEYIVATALQDEVTGIINCCSGVPITIKELVEDYLSKQNKKINLNLGYYPYPDYEPMHFWGDIKKLSAILKLKIV